jgi:hypothetical protein
MLQPGLMFFHCEVLERLFHTEYSYLVFRDLETGEIYISTRFPRWNWNLPEKGTRGYIEVEYVVAGKSEYYKDGNTDVYKNTYIAFRRFIKETKGPSDEIIM